MAGRDPKPGVQGVRQTHITKVHAPGPFRSLAPKESGFREREGQGCGSRDRDARDLPGIGINSGWKIQADYP